MSCWYLYFNYSIYCNYRFPGVIANKITVKKYAPGGGTVVTFYGRILALGRWNLQMSWCKCPGVPWDQPPGKCITLLVNKGSTPRGLGYWIQKPWFKTLCYFTSQNNFFRRCRLRLICTGDVDVSGPSIWWAHSSLMVQLHPSLPRDETINGCEGD